MTELVVYNDDQPTRFIDMKKIQVGSLYDKEQLLLAFKYIHDLKCIDPDYVAVCYIMHLYQHPELIEIVGE